MIRDWIDVPLEQLEANVAAWFADHAMDSASGPGPLPLVGLLVLALSRWIPTRTGLGGRYADLGARTPAPAGHRRQRSAPPCCGHRYRPRRSRTFVTRIRADRRRRAARARA
jgi:CRISPR-associated protein Csd1